MTMLSIIVLGTPTSETFDLTLMICLIRNLTKIRIEDELPFSGNDVVGADLTTIKFYRNKIMHSNDGLLKDVLFNKWWDETSKAIIQVGGTSFKERCCLWKVGRLERNDRDILIEIRNMIGTFDPVPKGVRKINEGIILEWDKENVAQTRAMKRLTEMVELHNVAVAVGPSGCGKSTAMHFIAGQLARVQDYDIVVVSSPEQMKNYYDPESKQIFVIHNIFGAYTFEQDKAMKWLEMTKDIKIMLDSNRVKLLASCKTHIFKHQIVEKLEVLSETSCDFSASNYCLTDDERLNIANLYLTEDEIRLLKSSNAWSEFYFFPLLCQLYSRKKSGNVVEYFKYPIESLSAVLMDMKSFDQTALATLFLFVVYNNCIEESSLTEVTKIKPLLKVISVNFELKSHLSTHVVKNEIEKLKNSYIEKRNTEYTIIHNKIFDIFVLFFGEHMFDLLIDLAHTDVIRDRFTLSRLPREKDMHEIVVQISLEQENKYIERLKKDIEQGYIKNVFFNRNLNETSFRLNFRKSIPNNIDFTLPDQAVFSMLMLMLDRGFCDIVSIFVTKMINLDQIYWDGETALFKAAHKGYIDIFRLLLKQNANPNFHACFNWLNHIDIVYPGITINSICDNSKTPSRYSPPPLPSCKIIKLDILPGRSSGTALDPYTNVKRTVKAYLEHLSTKQSKQFQLNKMYEISPLHIAVSKGFKEVVELLLSQNAEPNYINECNKIASPLFTASSKGYIDIVRLLLEHIPKRIATVPKRRYFDMKNYNPSSLDISLYIAVVKNYYDIVKLLLSHKTVLQPSPRYIYWELVSIGIINDYDAIVSLLLEQDIDSSFPEGYGRPNFKSPFSLLFKCICEEKTEIVKLLLEHKFDTCTYGNEVESPLYRASFLGHTEIVKLLLHYNSQSCEEEDFYTNHDASEKTPLYIGSYKGHTAIVELLLNHQDHSDIDKQYALHIATHEGHTEIVKLLLKHKTNPDAYTSEQKTPFKIALERGHTRS
ncbi:Hypothetical predicted protein [Mytilus galloprovincialis]|uniref:DZIP3-like HEPN domain-containing protein n=1 Tax=Mytilus galloprovincialis TaxID=29158 RepID=A0A8B6BHR8_MYTGA|nr:Hypothetical predicted protein [Mytilus galloprovincialis]